MAHTHIYYVFRQTVSLQNCSISRFRFLMALNSNWQFVMIRVRFGRFVVIHNTLLFQFVSYSSTLFFSTTQVAFQPSHFFDFKSVSNQWVLLSGSDFNVVDSQDTEALKMFAQVFGNQIKLVLRFLLLTILRHSFFISFTVF